MSTVIKVTDLSKIYRLGEIGTGTISRDLERWYRMRIRGQEDPFLRIGETNDRSKKGVSDVVYSLRDINFEVQQGEALGIIGKNGAGKSTLLKIISRVTSPTTGKINIKGRVASLLEVGTGFHPELTGRENIYLNGAILGMRKNEITRKLDEIIDFSEVERYIDTPVKRYSSGMYVRLAFAVAAHLESEILIVDEVLAVGDAEFQKKCLGKMGEVSKGEGRTVLFVSHNMAAIINLCIGTVLLKDGFIQSKGLTKKIVEEYISTGNSTSGEVLEKDIIYRQKNPRAYFNAIRLKSKTGVSDSFGIGEEIQIELEYIVKVDGSIIYPSIHLLDNFGTCIFATANFNSANTDVDHFYNKPLKTGLYKSICSIPANFLNEKSYKVNAYLVPENAAEMAMVEEALTFNILDTGEMRKEFLGGWIGQIRPRMKWKTELLKKL